jgi:hypothetical protein
MTIPPVSFSGAVAHVATMRSTAAAGIVTRNRASWDMPSQVNAVDPGCAEWTHRIHVRRP